MAVMTTAVPLVTINSRAAAQVTGIPLAIRTVATPAAADICNPPGDEVNEAVSLHSVRFSVRVGSETTVATKRYRGEVKVI